MTIQQRKADHIRINLEEDVGFLQLTNGLEHIRLEHQALPELHYNEVDTRQTIFGKELAAPILVSSMTGGTEHAQKINLNLAQAAQEYGLALGMGSQRAAIVAGETIDTFKVRSVAPDILLFANIGAVQLNYGFGVAECQQAVDMIEADALFLHLNPMQEVFQEGGDLDWRHLVDKIATICAQLAVPVIIKEVGWGISHRAATQLLEAGVAAIDVAGGGGTSWSQVEMLRAPTARRQRLAATFRDWGISTADSLRTVAHIRDEYNCPELVITASGGIRNGLEIAKCVALGADLVGLASPFLKCAVVSAEAVMEEMSILQEELKIAMFCSGTQNLTALRGSVEV
ncbi:MAG: type 2 isopentenyl-diphosphate Delta-isomerase [Chloroflexota bacterium]